MSEIAIDEVQVQVQWAASARGAVPELHVTLGDSTTPLPLTLAASARDASAVRDYTCCIGWITTALLLRSNASAPYEALRFRVLHKGAAVAARELGPGTLSPTAPIDLLAPSDPFAV